MQVDLFAQKSSYLYARDKKLLQEQVNLVKEHSRKSECFMV